MLEGPLDVTAIEDPMIPFDSALDFESNSRGVFVVNHDNFVRNIFRHNAKEDISENEDHIINTLSGKKSVPVRRS